MRKIRSWQSFSVSAVGLLWLLGSPSRTGAAEDLRPWVDSETHLIWTNSDNAAGVTLAQAKRYCRELTVAGRKGWKLPTIDQLQTLLGGEANENGRHIRGPLKLTGWQWSSTPGQQEGEGWVLDFGDGGRASVPAGDSGLNRSLCVREP
jgi:hypothetical protein